MGRKRKWVKFSKDFRLSETKEVMKELWAVMDSFNIKESDLINENGKTKVYREGVTFQVLSQKISGSWNSFTDNLVDIEDRLLEEQNSPYGSVNFHIKIEVNLELLNGGEKY